MFKLEWTIKFGDLLTTITVAISVVALLISWSKDRFTRRKEQADKVRTSVAVTIAKLDRWEALRLSAFQELQPMFVEASEMLAKDFNIVAARDFLWKVINVERTKIAGKILDEQIESAYVGLFSHFPAIRPLFLETFDQLGLEEEKVHEGFLDATQGDVLAFEKGRKEYTSAMLGNALRASAGKSKTDLEQRTKKTMKPVREFLLEVVSKPDRDILTQGLAPQHRGGKLRGR